MTPSEIRRGLSNKAARFFSPLAALWLRFEGVEIDSGCRLFGMPIIRKASGSTIRIGRKFTARSNAPSNSIGVIQPVVISTIQANACVEIGDDVGISGSSLSAFSRIRLGNRVSIGSGGIVLDNDSHPLDPSDRANELANIRSMPVVLEDDVFVGARCIILKGTEIGARSIVRAGSVVLGKFPADCILGGNPAVVLSRK